MAKITMENPPKLFVRRVPGAGGARLALCLEDGKMLPGQVGSTFEGYLDDLGVLHVTFRINGDDVIFEDEDS